MNNDELKIKCQTFVQTRDKEFFEVTWSPDHVYRETNSNLDYERILKMVNEACPSIIVIDPEGMNSITLVKLLHDLQEKYNPSTRTIQRGGEFVEKFLYHELILQLKT